MYTPGLISSEPSPITAPIEGDIVFYIAVLTEELLVKMLTESLVSLSIFIYLWKSMFENLYESLPLLNLISSLLLPRISALLQNRPV